MFNRYWFIKHQGGLLFLLNAPIIKLWFRRVLRINGGRSSVGNNRIVRIDPNAIFWFTGKRTKEEIEVVAEFRTHSKFSKRLYFAFKPMWYLFHAWDMAVNSLRLPALNLGFDTITRYPSAGAVDPVDGETFKQNAVWATARANDAGSADNVGTLNNNQASLSAGDYYVENLHAIFDTSAIPASGVISSAIYSRYDTNEGFVNDNTDTLYVVASTIASNAAVAVTDHQAWGSTSFFSIALASTTRNAYNDFTLNTSGIATIGKGSGGRTKLATIMGRNFNNVAPTGVNRIQFYNADQTGTTNDPKLVVTYTYTAPSSILLTNVG